MEKCTRADFDRLRDYLCDMILEEQLKLGYEKETIRFYSPCASIGHILGLKERSCETVMQALAPFEKREDLRVGILIGPEGGISEKEARWLTENANAKLVTLGPRILRTETAGLCALTMVMAYRGEME